MSVHPQAASFGPGTAFFRRRRRLCRTGASLARSEAAGAILDVDHYASGCKECCGLAPNQKLPLVDGHFRINKRHLLARGLRSSGVAEGYAGQALLGHGVHFFKPNGATASAILDVDYYASGCKECCGLAPNQNLPLVNGHYCPVFVSVRLPFFPVTLRSVATKSPVYKPIFFLILQIRKNFQ
jgi:hypothetical protein